MGIGELARAAEVSTATIHFYVKEGLLPPPRRINRTRAAWSPLHLRILRAIGRLKASGLPLAVIARMLTELGPGEEGLEKLEGIGYFQPLPAARGHRDRTPIEPFEPLPRAAFLARAEVAEAVLATAEGLGVVRPRNPGRYDARDLWALRQLQVLLDDGIELDQLAPLAGLVALSREVAPLVQTQATTHREALRRRELRFREIMEPWSILQGYVLDRILDEANPTWRERLFGGDR